MRQNELRAFERTFREQTSELVGTLAAASLDAVLSSDRPVLDTVIESLLEEDPDIEAVQVHDDRGDSITSWSRDEGDAIDRAGSIELSRDVVLEGETYGRFDVLWNVSRRHAEIRGHATRIYLYAAGISVVPALLILAIPETLILRPVGMIHERLRHLDGGAEPPPLEFASSRELRDIGATVDSLGDVPALRRRKEAELEAVSRQKSEFLANMSHELPTPMNGVLGMRSLVSDTPLDSRQAEQVRIASASGRSLLRLIDDILDLSKVEAGKLECEAIAFDIESLVDESAQVLAGQAEAKGLALACHITGETPVRVCGDPTRLRQALTNLAGNAIEFTSAGRIDIRVRRADACGPARPGALRFEVVDTGVGIAADALESVFESFAQADGSTTRHYGGTGLGLAISRQLVEGMGGAIGVESTPEEGSTFRFELDLTGAQAGGGAGPAVAARARAALAAVPAGRVVFLCSEPELGARFEGLCAELRVDAELARDAGSLLVALRRSRRADGPLTCVFDTRADTLSGALLLRLVEADPAFDDIALVPLGAVGDDAPGPEGSARIVRTLSRPLTRPSLVRTLLRGEGDAASSGTPDPAGPRLRERLRGVRVLVVEDNPVNQEVASGMLAKLGVHAELADNGEAGLAKLAADRFDAVLMDCQMPVMDGYAATRTLREREASAGAGAHVPVIALTANAMHGDAERCLAAGMDDYLAQPFDPLRLEEKLVHWAGAPDDDRVEDHHEALAA